MVIQKSGALIQLIMLKEIANVMAVYTIKYLSAVWAVPWLLSSRLDL